VSLGRKDSGSESDAKRLYDDKLTKNGYNKLIRPVGNTSDALTVRIGLRLTQIIDVVNTRPFLVIYVIYII
jgi:Neurotransmitter-gated ion-channel ligand binding domain